MFSEKDGVDHGPELYTLYTLRVLDQNSGSTWPINTIKNWLFSLKSGLWRQTKTESLRGRVFPGGATETGRVSLTEQVWDLYLWGGDVHHGDRRQEGASVGGQVQVLGVLRVDRCTGGRRHLDTKHAQGCKKVTSPGLSLAEEKRCRPAGGADSTSAGGAAAKQTTVSLLSDPKQALSRCTHSAGGGRGGAVEVRHAVTVGVGTTGGRGEDGLQGHVGRQARLQRRHKS